MQHGDLARFTYVAQRSQRAMHSSKRDMRMLEAHLGEDSIGPRMVAGADQRLDNRQALGRHRQSAAAVSVGEFGQPLGSVRSTPPFIYQL